MFTHLNFVLLKHEGNGGDAAYAEAPVRATHQEPGLEQVDGLVLLVHRQLALVVERPRQLRRADVQPQRRPPAVEAAAVLAAGSSHYLQRFALS